MYGKSARSCATPWKTPPPVSRPHATSTWTVVNSFTVASSPRTTNAALSAAITSA